MAVRDVLSSSRAIQCAAECLNQIEIGRIPTLQPKIGDDRSDDDFVGKKRLRLKRKTQKHLNHELVLKRSLQRVVDRAGSNQKRRWNQ